MHLTEHKINLLKSNKSRLPPQPSFRSNGKTVNANIYENLYI